MWRRFKSKVLPVLLVAITVVVLGTFAWDYSLNASDGDDTTSAADQQAAMQMETAPAEIVLPPQEELPQGEGAEALSVDTEELQGSIVISGTEGTHFYGDIVTLYSRVEGVEAPYSITWEADYGAGWVVVGGGSNLTFELTEQAAQASYRATLEKG